MNRNRRVLLNLFDDPKLSECEYATVGDEIYSIESEEEFGLTKNKPYEVLDTNGFDLVKIRNDNDNVDWYSVEYFSKHEHFTFGQGEDKNA